MDVEEFVSEVDSTNHPFYTGRRQYVDTAGRVEKFMRRYGKKARSSSSASSDDASDDAADDASDKASE